MVIRCREKLCKGQSNSEKILGAKGEMDPPRGGHGKSSASEDLTLGHDKGKGGSRRGKHTATQAQLHAHAAAELF